jgi:glucosylceramidase
MSRPSRTLWTAALILSAMLAGATPSLGARRTDVRRPTSLGRKQTTGRSAQTAVQVALTSANLSAALAPQPSLSFTATAPRGLKVLDVNDMVRYQHFTGVGAAMTDSSAWLIYKQLSPVTRNALMSGLFSARGIHMNFLRVPIGASDFTATGIPYSYDDMPAGQSDPTLANFTVSHDQAYIIPSLRQAVRLNPQISVFANPWSPPPWMKANQAFDNNRAAGTLLESSYGPLATYFVRFIRAYAQAGIPVSALSAQNEPTAQSPYPGLNLPPEDEALFIAQYLHPALNSAGLHPKIYGMDRGATPSYAQTLLSSQAAPLLAGIAWHCYGGQTFMSQTHQMAPDADQLISECSPGIIPYTASELVISAARNWASAAAMWNIALDPAGGPVQPPNYGCPQCSGLVTISETTHRVSYNLNYFQLGQVGRYVQPGALRISSPRWVSDFRSADGHYGVTPGLDNVAFLNPDGSKVLIAYNNSTVPVSFAVRSRGRCFAYRLRARATATFVWDRR